MNAPRVLFEKELRTVYNTHTLRFVLNPFGRIEVEERKKDALENPSWVPYEFKIGLIDNVFPDSEKAWKKVSSISPRGGTERMFDSSSLKGDNGVTCVGVIHRYSTKNNHAPDDEEQSVYVRVPFFGETVLRPATGYEEQQILMGVLMFMHTVVL